MNDFPELTQPLCEDDYDWLSENAPQYINAVQASLAKKNTPDPYYTEHLIHHLLEKTV